MEPEQLGCTLTSASSVQQAIKRRGKRTFEFIHEFDSTLPWRCMAACPKIQYVVVKETNAPSNEPFPLIDPRSLYSELPVEFHTQDQVVGTDINVPAALVDVDDVFEDDAADYDMGVIQFDGSLTDYYDPEVGLPGTIYITELPPR